MTNHEDELLSRWEKEKDVYQRWGGFVACRVENLIVKRIAPRSIKHFVRVPAIPRVKDDESLLQKAFYRGKNYAQPYDSIEDKVGVRFVLLLDADVKLVGSLIENETAVWSAVKQRDHEEEIIESPYEFNYQSLHYVVRSTQDLTVEGIPENLPCEVQVRTLLQHAYSEVTHDTIYKTSIRTTAPMKRAAAKSMALLEATSDYFEDLNDLIADQVKPLRELSDTLVKKYSALVGSPPSGNESPLNSLVLDRYGRNVDTNNMVDWLHSNPFIGERISERAKYLSSFRIPSVLLIYFCAYTCPNDTLKDCPILDKDLELIYNDLGKSING